jgi:hypothetical protein
MTHQIQHGRRHEIEFYAEPDANEFLDGIAEVIHGPGNTWSHNPGTSFRCLHISPDRCVYIIEEIDIWQSLLEKNPKKYDYNKVVEINLTCETCAAKYQVWRVVGDDWRQDRYWLHIAHCANCPPMSTDVWLAGLGYYQDRPALTDLRPSNIQNTLSNIDVDMSDFV